MAQGFVTIYANDYRRHKIERRKSLRPVDRLATTIPEGDIWLIRKKIGEEDGESGGGGLAEATKAIQRMIRTRLWSTYQVSYCPDMLPKQGHDEDEDKGGALLEYGDALYAPKTMKILPPIAASRRTFGYIRPSMVYTSLSHWQNVHGRVAYETLKRNAGFPESKIPPGKEFIQKEKDFLYDFMMKSREYPKEPEKECLPKCKCICE